MANDLSAFNSEAWAMRLVTKLDQINVLLPLANRNWEGDLRQNKTVWVRTPGNIAMASYSRGATISYQDLAPTKESFTVNDGEYFAFEVDDLDKAQSDVNAMDVYLKRAAVAMNNCVETKLATSMVVNTPIANQIVSSGAGTLATATATVTSGTIAAITVGTAGSGYTTGKVGVVLVGGNPTTPATGTVTVTTGTIAAITVVSGGAGYTSVPTVVITAGSTITLDSSTTAGVGIYPVFTKARSILSKNNVPATFGSRWAVIDPDTTSLILNDTAHFIRASDLGDRMVQSGVIGGEEVARAAAANPGFIGAIAGFLVYESSHTVKDFTGGSYLSFGDHEAVSYANQITEIEILRLQTTFANAVRGLMLHDTFTPAESAKRLVYVRAA